MDAPYDEVCINNKKYINLFKIYNYCCLISLNLIKTDFKI